VVGEVLVVVGAGLVVYLVVEEVQLVLAALVVV
jgi:hypothetical protein